MSLGLSVADLMVAPVETVAPSESALAVADRLHAGDAGSLVVVDDGEPVGIVTGSDLLARIAAGVGPDDATAGDIMSGPLVTVESSTSVTDAVTLLEREGVSKLPVVDDGALVGIITTTDLAHYVPRVLRRRDPDAERPPVDQRADVRATTAYEQDDWTFASRIDDPEQVSVGDVVEFSKPISDEDVRSFAAVSGDTNRLHLEEDFAADTRFGGRIAHGTLLGGLISAALARLPGLTIYLSQELTFQGPLRVGDRALATCEVMESLGRDRYVLTTDVHAADGELLIEGEAVVLIDEMPATEEK